jgi:hypothetical protein
MYAFLLMRTDLNWFECSPIREEVAGLILTRYIIFMNYMKMHTYMIEEFDGGVISALSVRSWKLTNVGWTPDG